MLQSAKRLIQWLVKRRRQAEAAVTTFNNGTPGRRRQPPMCPICRGGGQVVVGVLSKPATYTCTVRGCFVCGGAGCLPQSALKALQGQPGSWEVYRKAWPTN